MTAITAREPSIPAKTCQLVVIYGADGSAERVSFNRGTEGETRRSFQEFVSETSDGRFRLLEDRLQADSWSCPAGLTNAARPGKFFEINARTKLLLLCACGQSRRASRPENWLKRGNLGLQFRQFGGAQLGQRLGRQFHRKVKDAFVTRWYGGSDLLV